MTMIDFRRSILIGLGASSPVADEVLAYNENVFQPVASPDSPADEPFVDAWRRYTSFEELRRALIQLQFPIRRGISGTDAYVRAVREGVPPSSLECGLQLEEPHTFQIQIHSSAAGGIPLLIAGCRADFVTLVRALTRKNEPELVPHSMGACMVSGYTNWDRIGRHRELWERAGTPAAWSEELQALLRRKELYQDRFIILSDGPYSAVPADQMGLSEAAWRRYSLIIRREHECAHYYTRRFLGSMRNRLLDELIADYMGIAEVAGRFRADWFLRFMGLERHPDYRPGARFENYVGGLSEAAVELLQRLLVRAAVNLELYGPLMAAGKGSVLNRLCRLTLEEMASTRLMKGIGASGVRVSAVA